MLLLLLLPLPPLGGLLLLLPLLRWALPMLGVLQLLGGPAHRAQGGVEPRGGGGERVTRAYTVEVQTASVFYSR